VELSDDDQAVLDQLAARTASAQDGEPLTGAEIGSADADEGQASLRTDFLLHDDLPRTGRLPWLRGSSVYNEDIR
jgi:hypothetical protein